jgi:hypothetical protein
VNLRTVYPVLVVCCLLLAGCVGFDTGGATPTPTTDAPTPDDRFALRVTNDATETVAVRAWFVTGSLDGVVVTAADGTNTTYSAADLEGTPLAVNATAVTPQGDVDRSVGIRLSGGVDGVANADVTGVQSVVYAVTSGDGEETTPDAGGAVRVGGDERVEYVGVVTCADGESVTGLTVAVGAETTTAVTCEG